MSYLVLPDFTTHVKISYGFPFHTCILEVINDWSWWSPRLHPYQAYILIEAILLLGLQWNNPQQSILLIKPIENEEIQK